MGQINAGTWMVSLVILVGSEKSMNERHRTKQCLCLLSTSYAHKTQAKEIDLFGCVVTWFEMGKRRFEMVDAQARVSDHSISWTKSLAFVPKFSYVQINQRLKDCRKKEIGEKGYKYFVVYVSRTSSAVSTVKARCYRSKRKSEKPHTFQICVLSSNGEANVSNASCSCKAG